MADVNLLGSKPSKQSSKFSVMFDNSPELKKIVGTGKGIVIHIPDAEAQLSTLPANEKGNRVLNVYHKLSDVAKFSGNLIYNG